MKTSSVSRSPNYDLPSLVRSFRMATWLGWQIESNWTDPFLFLVYSVVKPLSGAAILVVMYGVISRGNFNTPIFPYIYLGNAFYIFVGQIMNGMAWAVVDDREHYKTLKYIYTAPVNYPAYLIGRSIAGFVISSVSVTITILCGILFLHVRINPAEVNWPLFFLALVLGSVMLTAMGMILAGIMLLLVHHSWELGGAVAGALYLFSGAIFPLDTLPAFLRPIGYAMPVTYWLEVLRRSLVGHVAQAFPTLQGLSNLDLIAILSGLIVVFASIAAVSFRWCEQQARERGYLDRVTNY